MKGCKGYNPAICNVLSFKSMPVYAFGDKILYFCAMRLLTYILTMLVLTLSCLPCADGAVVNPDVENASLVSHPASDHHEDACSPFCICTCCASFSYVYHTVFYLAKPVSSPHYSFFYVRSLHEISLPVWQPPQLV